MFSQKKKQYYSNVLGFKTVEDFENFAKRYKNFLEKEPLTKNRIMLGFFIMLDIQKKSLTNNSNLINFEGIKNQHVKKYANEILEERKKGHGSQAIVKYLFESHRVVVSRGTISKFYKLNNL